MPISVRFLGLNERSISPEGSAVGAWSMLSEGEALPLDSVPFDTRSKGMGGGLRDPGSSPGSQLGRAGSESFALCLGENPT